MSSLSSGSSSARQAPRCDKCHQQRGVYRSDGKEALLCWDCFMGPRLELPDLEGEAGDDEEGFQLGEIPEYPIEALPADVRPMVENSGLPTGLVAGALLGALCASIGSRSSIYVKTWRERANLWIPLLGPTGSGKSPSQELAFAPLHARSTDEDRLIVRDVTLEALGRELDLTGGALAIEPDELSQFLRGLGEYKHGGGDRSRLLALWDGSPWSLTRVGSGGPARNKVRIWVERPTVTVVGGLQTHLHDLLGDDQDGMRGRWLPHLVAMPEAKGDLITSPFHWAGLVQSLLDERTTDRAWTLPASAERLFGEKRAQWQDLAHQGESQALSAALAKADRQLLRVALVIAEADRPGVGGKVFDDELNRASLIVDYALDCWRALPETGGLALSVRDSKLDAAIARLVAYLEGCTGRQATRRQLQRARVAGARTPQDLDALLIRYGAMYPGSVTSETPAHGGKEIPIVKAPGRRPLLPVSPRGDIGSRCGENADEHGRFADVTTGDTRAGDTDLETPIPAASRRPATIEIEDLLAAFPGATIDED